MDGNVSSGRRDDLIVAAVAHSIRSLDLPLSLFDDLLSAFGQDTTTTRYDSWRDVLDYCRRSANPIGRLVLRIAGIRNEALDRSSDALCTALQLTNFWQDFGRDWRAGRLYVPAETMKVHGAVETDLTRGELTAAWTKTIDDCIAVTREKLREARPLCDEVRGRLRWELRLTWLGGSRMLDLVELHRSRLLDERPTLASGDWARLAWQAARWGHWGPGGPWGARGQRVA
jgi:squalene synthase HpnC